MRMGAEACVGLDAILIDDTKRTVFLMRGALISIQHNLRTYNNELKQGRAYPANENVWKVFNQP